MSSLQQSQEPTSQRVVRTVKLLNYTRYTGGSAGWLVFAGTLVFFFVLNDVDITTLTCRDVDTVLSVFFSRAFFCKFGLRVFSHTKWRTTSIKLLQYRETDMLQMQQIHICHLKLTFLILFLETVQNLLVHGYRGLKLHLMSQLYHWIRPNFSL